MSSDVAKHSNPADRELARVAGKPFKTRRPPWDRAKALVLGLEPRQLALMFRFCVAQVFNRHQPPVSYTHLTLPTICSV